MPVAHCPICGIRRFISEPALRALRKRGMVVDTMEIAHRVRCQDCDPQVGIIETNVMSESLSNKTVAHEFPFKSKSNPNNSYTCRLYTDGTTSCNCPGWTRQVKNGVRECKHTLLVDGMKDQYLGGGQPAPTPARAARALAVSGSPKKGGGRKFDFDS